MLPKTIIKSNHLELMNRFMEIAINNVKPVIYKTNYEGWGELWYNIKNNYKIMNFEKYGDRQLMVKKLMDKGFKPHQIDVMEDVILNVNVRMDDITAYINPTMSIEEIEEILYAN